MKSQESVESDYSYKGSSLTFASDNYYPLVLSSPEWSLHIQSKPKARIYRTGRIPTYQEIGETLRHVNAPVWSIELFQVLIELAEVKS